MSGVNNTTPYTALGGQEAKDRMLAQCQAAPMHTQSFGWALKELQNGARVSRMGWNGPGQWLALQRPDAHSKMTLPYIFINTTQNQRVPWIASQTDMLATDWYVVGY